uniref:Uncharacterized protein n=1 Tax=Phage sp. ctesc4 TaxID=2828008 RepID=A0A8S5TCX1_9VIRU|nr:MAG TPA: hypothetical protein [Phage sp. ctesc4]
MGIYLDGTKTTELHRARGAVHGFANSLSGALFQNEADRARDCQVYRGLESVRGMCSQVFWMIYFNEESSRYVAQLMMEWSRVRKMLPGEYSEDSCEFNILKMARVLVEAVSDTITESECEKA